MIWCCLDFAVCHKQLDRQVREEPVFLAVFQKNLYAENASAVISQRSSGVVF